MCRLLNQIRRKGGSSRGSPLRREPFCSPTRIQDGTLVPRNNARSNFCAHVTPNHTMYHRERNTSHHAKCSVQPEIASRHFRAEIARTVSQSHLRRMRLRRRSDAMIEAEYRCSQRPVMSRKKLKLVTRIQIPV